MVEKIGLIAGNRKFPLLFAEAAKKNHVYIAAVALKHDTAPELKKFVDKIYWLGLGDFSRMFEIFKQEGIEKIVMAGQVSPHRLFSKDIGRSKEIKELLESIKDKKADTIFGAIAEKLQESGFQLLDSTTFLKHLLPEKGTLTCVEPDFRVWEDIYFGLDLAKTVAYLDIGQTVAIKEKAVVAVEALEGTDNVIRRAGRLAGAGVTVVKVSKPKQDLRFDVPVVGFNTIKCLAKAKARCLAIEAGKTLFIDKDKSIKAAEQAGISLVSL